LRERGAVCYALVGNEFKALKALKAFKDLRREML